MLKLTIENHKGLEMLSVEALVRDWATIPPPPAPLSFRTTSHCRKLYLFDSKKVFPPNSRCIRGVVKKHEYFMVRLTVRVDIPPYDQLAAICLVFTKKQVFFGPKSLFLALFSRPKSSHLLGVRAEGIDPPPSPHTVSLTVKYPF